MIRKLRMLLIAGAFITAGLLIVALAGCPLAGKSISGIFVAGSYNSPSNIACYWDNGTKTDLDTGGNTPSYATSIFVSGGTIYVGGYYLKGTAYVGCYWTIGGARTDLDSGTGTGAHVNSIFVSGGTVYTAGYYNNLAQSSLLAIGREPPEAQTCRAWVPHLPTRSS